MTKQSINKKALIVDDSRTAYTVLARILKSYHIKAEHARSGDEAIEYLRQNSVDVIFLDQAMPGKDGFETIKEIKKEPKTAYIPVMMFTARTGDQYEREIKAMGAIGVLPKELNEEDVEAALIKLNFWGAVPGDVIAERIEHDLLQPTADEKLRVWLESFLENEFSPKLTDKVQSATDDLRRDTIHYGKRMLDELARTDKQQALLDRVSGQTDHLKQLFISSFKQYRVISIISITGLALLILGLLWSIMAGYSLQKDTLELQKELATLKQLSTNNQRAITDQYNLLTDFVSQLDSTNTQQAPLVLLSESDSIAQVVGVDTSGKWINGRTGKGYMFMINTEGKVSNINLELYYLGGQCSGAAYAQVLEGVVLRMDRQQLGYAELSGEISSIRPVSYRDNGAVCQTYVGQEIALRQILPNVTAITGVEDLTYRLE